MSFNIKFKRIKYLLILLIIMQVMLYLVTPKPIDYSFEEERTILSDFFAVFVSFVIPLLIILGVSMKKKKLESKKTLFEVESLFEEKISIKQILYTLIMALLMSVLIFYVVNLLKVILILITNNYQILEAKPDFSIILFFGTIIFMTILAFFEEIIFRKMIFVTLKHNKNFCMFFSALVFSLFSDGLFTSFSVFILGLFLIWFFIKSNSLIFCMMLHIFYNVFTLLFNSLLDLPFRAMILINNYISAIGFFGMFLIYLGIIILCYKIMMLIFENMFDCKNDVKIKNDKFFVKEKVGFVVTIIILVVFYCLRIF